MLEKTSHFFRSAKDLLPEDPRYALAATYIRAGCVSQIAGDLGKLSEKYSQKNRKFAPQAKFF